MIRAFVCEMEINVRDGEIGSEADLQIFRVRRPSLQHG